MKKLFTLSTLLIAVIFGLKAQVVVFSTIDSARLPQTDGAPLDSGKLVQVSGTVYGPNFYPTANGMSFWLNDGTAGIKIYSKHIYSSYPTLINGDRITVVGLLGSYYGAAEIDLSDTAALDTIIKTASGVTDTPVVILTSGLSTQTYGELVQINNVDMTAATKWAIVAGKTYFTAQVGSNPKLYIYIDSFVNAAMYNAAQPQGIYNVVGIGDEYSTTEFNIDPRSLADFIPVNATGINSIADRLTAVVYPNPAAGQVTVKFNSDVEQDVNSKMFDVTGREVLLEKGNAVAGDNTINLNTTALSNGLYVLEVRLGEKSMITKINIVK